MSNMYDASKTPKAKTDRDLYKGLYKSVLEHGHQIECLEQQLRDAAAQFHQASQLLVDQQTTINELLVSVGKLAETASRASVQANFDNQR